MSALRAVLSAAVCLAVLVFVVSSMQAHEKRVAQFKSQYLAAAAASLSSGPVDTGTVTVGKLQKNGTPAVKEFCVSDADHNGVCLPAKGKLEYPDSSGGMHTCEWDSTNPKQNACINNLGVRSAMAHGDARFTPEGMTVSYPLSPMYGNSYILDAFSGTVPTNVPYETTKTIELPVEDGPAPQKAVLPADINLSAIKSEISNDITPLNREAANNSQKDINGGANASPATFPAGDPPPEAASAVDKDTSQPTLPADAKKEDVVNFIKNDRLPADNTNQWVEKVWPEDKPVMFLMERHNDAPSKEELLKVLDSGKVTNLVWEYFRSDLSYNVQQAYLEGRLTREEFLKDDYLKEAAGCDNSYTGYPGCTAALLDILDKAKEKGIRVSNLEYVTSLGDETSPDAVYSRNIKWADNIQSAINSDPNARVVVFGGMGHTGYVDNAVTANQLLAERGTPSVVVSVAGHTPNALDDIFPWTTPNNQMADKLITQMTNTVRDAATVGGFGQDRFLLPIAPGQNGMYPADYVLYLPQQPMTSSEVYLNGAYNSFKFFIGITSKTLGDIIENLTGLTPAH